MPWIAPAIIAGVAVYNAVKPKDSVQAAPVTPAFGSQDPIAALTQSRAGEQNALDNQANLASSLQPGAAQGIAGQSQVYGQQQQLAQALTAQAAGGGPNPALDQLNQSTAANTANTASLMAGQRGSGANTGLLARQIGQQGAALQQSAIGQGATLQANQQLAAQQELMSQQNSMANLASNQVNQYGSTVNANAGNSLANKQSDISAVMGQNQINSQNQGQVNSAISSSNNIGQTAIANGLGGTINGLGGALGLNSTTGASGTAAAANSAGQSNLDTTQMGYDGGTVSPNHDAIASIYHGRKMAGGGKVPGVAPKPMENSPENDIVDAKLSPGEIVIPLEVLHSKDPIKASAAFVAKELAKHGGNEHEDFKDALKKAIAGRKSK